MLNFTLANYAKGTLGRGVQNSITNLFTNLITLRMKDRITSLLVRFSKRAFFVALFSMLAIGAMAQSKVTGTVLDKAGRYAPSQ